MASREARGRDVPPSGRSAFAEASKEASDAPASFRSRGTRASERNGPERGAGREGRLASRGRRAAGGRRPATEACGRGSSVDHFRHGSPSAAALPTLRRLVPIAGDGGIARTTATQRTPASASRRHPYRLFPSKPLKFFYDSCVEGGEGESLSADFASLERRLHGD